LGLVLLVWFLWLCWWWWILPCCSTHERGGLCGGVAGVMVMFLVWWWCFLILSNVWSYPNSLVTFYHEFMVSNACHGVPFIVFWSSPQVDTSSGDSCFHLVSKLLVVKLSCMGITWGSSKRRYFHVDNYEHYLGFK
jgi:hypothetical protein